jgi:Ca2+/Na+ antiporter
MKNNLDDDLNVNNYYEEKPKNLDDKMSDYLENKINEWEEFKKWRGELKKQTRSGSFWKNFFTNAWSDDWVTNVKEIFAFLFFLALGLLMIILIFTLFDDIDFIALLFSLPIFALGALGLTAKILSYITYRKNKKEFFGK